MPRAKVIRTSEFPYHISTRTNNREFVQLNMPDFWEICLSELCVLDQKFECLIHQFVLMTNHYHLMMSTPQENVSEAMGYFNREIAKAYNLRTSRVNHLFGDRYRPTLIASETHYWNCVKYIFRNPVRAKICSNVTEYPYSSLNVQAGGFEWKMKDLSLEWLNEPSSVEAEESIRKGLRRSQFKLPRASSGRQIELDNPQYKKVHATF